MGAESPEPETVTIPDDLLAQGRAVIGLSCEATLIGWLRQGWPADWICQALPKAEAKGKRAGAAALYAEGILRNWTRNGGPENDNRNHRTTTAGGNGKSNRPPAREPDYSVGHGERI